MLCSVLFKGVAAWVGWGDRFKPKTALLHPSCKIFKVAKDAQLREGFWTKKFLLTAIRANLCTPIMSAIDPPDGQGVTGVHRKNDCDAGGDNEKAV